MGFLRPGPTDWSLVRDNESHRTYKVKFLVACAASEGPAQALGNTPGLPQYGDLYLIDADLDIWAFCRWPAAVTPVVTKEPNRFFEVELEFSTKPDKAFCITAQIEDPLLIPPKLSGSSVKYTEEAVQDRFGQPIVTSSWEQIRGPQVEFDKNRSRIHIEMPVPLLNFAFANGFVDRVNAFPIWGFGRRCVKLSDFNWERLYYGVCFPYYKWIFDFDVREDTFDRDILDEGTKVLHGHWDTPSGNYVLDPIGGNLPDATKPQHFDRYKDRNGENARVILDGYGLPAGVLLGAGTAQPSCAACAPGTTPTQIGIGRAPPELSDFVGAYEVYNFAFGLTLSADDVDGCFFFATYLAEDASRVNVTAVLAKETIVRDGMITVTMTNPTGTAPEVVYKVFVPGLPFDCSKPQVCLLISGDPSSCPSQITATPSGSAGGPQFTGPPGVRHVEKYDEVDFTLLGVPLTLE